MVQQKMNGNGCSEHELSHLSALCLLALHPIPKDTLEEYDPLSNLLKGASKRRRTEGVATTNVSLGPELTF